MARILVVDDDDVVRRLIVRLLASRGFDVDEAATGAQALALARAADFDVVVMDVVMPEKGGVETVLELRRERPRLKIVFVTGQVAESVRPMAELAAAFGDSPILYKPFDNDALVAAVQEAAPPAPETARP